VPYRRRLSFRWPRSNWSASPPDQCDGSCDSFSSGHYFRGGFGGTAGPVAVGHTRTTPRGLDCDRASLQCEVYAPAAALRAPSSRASTTRRRGRAPSANASCPRCSGRSIRTGRSAACTMTATSTSPSATNSNCRLVATASECSSRATRRQAARRGRRHPLPPPQLYLQAAGHGT
jgi:hypothetical protein